MGHLKSARRDTAHFFSAVHTHSDKSETKERQARGLRYLDLHDIELGKVQSKETCINPPPRKKGPSRALFVYVVWVKSRSKSAEAGAGWPASGGS